MSVPDTSPPSWDLTPAISLLHSFSLEGCQHERPASPKQTANGPINHATFASNALGDAESEKGAQPKLGDFGALFTFLSQTTPPKLGTVSDNSATHASSGKKDVLEAAAVLKHQLDGSRSPTKKVILKRDVPKRINSAGLSVLPTPTSGTVLVSPKSILRRPPATTAGAVVAAEAAPAPKGKRIVGSIIHIEPLLTGSTIQRQQALVSLLEEKHAKVRNNLNHGNLRECLCRPLKTAPAGIHVFVDMSNIMVGFHDCIKKSRDIPLTTRVRRLPLSFQNFALVLERARPVSKRVLVGSDRYPAIDEAETLGYEANILERVHKAKPSSPRKTKLSGGGGDKASRRALYDQSSSSETNAQASPERWVEQAVDEILHLKILESIVDTDTPSTIILATGDAAQAEYSDGFLKMVDRALSKGWYVELVSFSSITSRAYTRKSFRDKWGSRFRIFELDIYAEYLLDL
ncbi:conserved hypothetical protein [Trichophyton verrucosum HKI 0517]|uniref:NYN domain-containing protein n=1 Tax=Trichophyton verrucosum (strain HKI 0517) TaxID=663202 RepID=D4D991_TRIVH|nr:uncharacterized protein TRV_03682 [Trichophyton verrucosum HKI 0517]EFE41583.1 conserved hypothetical protein [Trichophyton verrucosum HKI 0517]